MTAEELVREARRTVAAQSCNGNGRGYHPDQGDEYAEWGAAIPPSDTQPMTARELVEKYPSLRERLIDGLLRDGETMNIIAPPKFGKSWLSLSLLLSVATGTRWLGFDVARRDVLLLDNELHPETLSHRIPRVAAALGIAFDDYADHLRVEPLRGQLKDLYSLAGYFQRLSDRPGLIVCDAWYRFMPRDCDENDNGSMSALYNQVDAAADTLGASFVLIHHSSKGDQSGKSVTDVGAGAGAQSRATDTHLILRQHEEDGCYVVDAAVRSFKPLDPFVLRFDWPIFRPAPELDPNALRRPPKKGAEKPSPKPEYTVAAFVAAFLSEKAKTEDAILVDADAAKLSDRKAKRLLKTAEEEGKVYRWVFSRSSKARYATIPQPVTETVSAGGPNAK